MTVRRRRLSTSRPPVEPLAQIACRGFALWATSSQARRLTASAPQPLVNGRHGAKQAAVVVALLVVASRTGSGRLTADAGKLGAPGAVWRLSPRTNRSVRWPAAANSIRPPPPPFTRTQKTTSVRNTTTVSLSAINNAA